MEWVQPNVQGTVPAIRNSHRAEVYNEDLLIFGGRGGMTYLDDLFHYNVKNLTWTKPNVQGSKPSARQDHAMAINGNILWMFGGNADGKLCNDLYFYQIDTATWNKVEASGRAPVPRDRHSLTCIDNKLFLFGGHSAEQEYLNDLHVYDIASNKWNLLFPGRAPIPRYHHTANVVNGKLVIFGGKSNSGSGCFNDIHVFDPLREEWVQPTVTGIFPAARWGHSTIVAAESKLIVFGGWNGTWCFNDVNMFDCATLSWSRLSCSGRVPIARAHHSCSIIGTKMILFGGRNGLRRMNDTYVLNLVAEADEKADDQAISLAANSTERTKYSLEDFELLDTLGTGSFGRVRFARHKSSGNYHAIKILKKGEILRLKQVDHIISERNILLDVHHPFIVRLFGTFQDERYIYFIMEYVIGGEFFTHLRRAGHFNNDTARFYAAQIVLIFQYLHSKDIVYRDLKPENLLLDANGNLKITDFGFAKHVEYRTWTLCGTPEYIAPEILLNKGHGKPVDWWALGILIYEMLAGAPPFVDEDPMGIYQKILAGKIEFPRYFDRHAKDLIKQLLQPDITKRLGNMKNGVEDVKRHKWFAGLDWSALYQCKIKPPFVPEVRGIADTHNFEAYPESTELAPAVHLENDPFADF